MVKQYKIQFDKSAKQDLKKIHHYIAEILLEPQIANNLVLKISNSLITLEYYPEAFPMLYKLNQVRKLIVKNYNILYSLNKNQRVVYILHIYHKAQKY